MDFLFVLWSGFVVPFRLIGDSWKLNGWNFTHPQYGFLPKWLLSCSNDLICTAAINLFWSLCVQGEVNWYALVSCSSSNQCPRQGDFWKIIFCCSCSCQCLCVNHIRKIVRKLKPKKILWGHFFNRYILLSNTSLCIYPYKRKCRWLCRTVFLPLRWWFMYCWKNLFLSSVLIYEALVVMKWSDSSYSVFYFT